MKRCRVLVCVAVFLMSMGCSDDASEGLTTTCGDGTLNNDEICDGEAFAKGVQVCPEGMVLKENAVFACTSTCGLDFSKACEVPTCNGDGSDGGSDGEGCTECAKAECGNDVLDGGEICDGVQIREDAKVCPEGMRLLDNAVWECTDSCLLDLTQACAPTTCGDGVLDAGETCEIDADGKMVLNDAPVCAEGYKLLENRNLLKCSECTLNSDNACFANDAKEPVLYFSELYAQNDADSEVSQHLYIEIGNLGAVTSVEDCKLVGIKDVDGASQQIKVDSFVFEYSLSEYAGKLGNTAGQADQVLTLCYENTEGWLKDQYDEATVSLEAHRAIGESIVASRFICQAVCDGNKGCDQTCADDADKKTCLKTCTSGCYLGCDEQFNYLDKEHQAEFGAVWARHVDENCDLYIPATMTNALQLTYARSAYNPKGYWGLALMCGNVVHDAVGLANLGHNSSERYCHNKTLDKIENTSTTIWNGSYYGMDQSALFDQGNSSWSATIGYAECGHIVIN